MISRIKEKKFKKYLDKLVFMWISQIGERTGGFDFENKK